MKSFAHLHVHTEHSALDGAARLNPLAARAAELGMPAIGMTDHGNMFGAYEFHRTAAAAGLKPILGVEAYVAPVSRHHKKPVFWGAGGQRDAEGEDVSGGGAYLHMTMLAETPGGLRNLFWLTSKASMEGHYRKPRMDKELIASRAGGIIATTGCPGGEVSTRLALGQYDEALKAAAEWQDILGKGNYFLEVMDHGVPIERKVRDGLLRLGKALGLPPLATNDSHYVMPGDADTHDNLLCIGVGKRKADEKRFRFAGEGYYLKSAEEMRALWDGQVPGACDNTLLIAERVRPYTEVFASRDLMPRFDVPAGHTQESWLRAETMAGLKARYGDPLGAEVLQRAEYELGVIEQTGFAAYFLVCADITRHARQIGVTVGPGRGSAAGSLVAYALRITELDPLAHGLMFERFLNPDRVSMPDADLDFDERRRGDVIRYVTEKYGAEHCSLILTFSKMKAKAAVKDAARVLDYPYAVGERITKAFPPATQGNEIPLDALFDAGHPRHKEAAPLVELYRSDPDAKTVLDAARGLEGITRGTGVHPAGVILSAVPLIDVVPLMKRESDGAIICGWPYQQAEELGLLKMDFLGLRNLTIMADALEGIRRRLGVTVDLETLPLDDAKTYQLLARGDTLGVFQLDGTGIRALLRLMKPTHFGDISAVGALYRPGPMGADSHTNYALRKNGAQPITPIHPDLAEPLAEILGETYGLIVYQEQVMAIAQKVAGFSLGKADLLRRAMGKKKKAELDKQYEGFESGMRERGFSVQAVKTLWDILLPFSDYAFNKCIIGQTVIKRLGRGGHDWPQTVENIANRIHGRPDYGGTGCRYCTTPRGPIGKSGQCRACKSWRAKWRMQGGMNAAGRVGDRVLPVKITDVFRQGVKPVWKMTLANGMHITSTANHRHLTPDGWRRLDELSNGDEVSVMAEGDWNTAAPRTEYSGGYDWAKRHGYIVGIRAHGKPGPFLHGRDALYRRNVAVLERTCRSCGSSEGRLEVAHLDGNPRNNARSNLSYLCNPCHKRHDYATGDRARMWRKGRAVTSSPVVSIEYAGEEMTYDVTVDSADHSWVANDGIITHNSHSAAYGLVSYWTAYLKANYPADYMAALLTSVGDNKDRMAIYLSECRHLGIKVAPPDVNSSELTFTATSDAEVRFGLGAVRNVGEGAAEAVAQGRRGRPYASFADYLARVPTAACTKRVTESLIKAGAFDALGHPRHGLMVVHGPAVERASEVHKRADAGQDSLFGDAEEEVVVPDVEWDKATLLDFEREMLGLYVSDHPLSAAEDTLRRHRTVTVAAVLEDGREGQQVTVCGMLARVEHRISKSGNAWGLMTVEDLDGQVEAVAFGKTYELCREALVQGAVLAVEGQVQQRDGGVSVVVSAVRRVEVGGAERPVVLNVRCEALTRPLVARLKRALAEHPGEVPVRIAVHDGARTTLFELPGFSVGCTPAFAGEVKGLLGANALER